MYTRHFAAGGGDIGEKRSFSKPLYRFLTELRALRYFEPSDGYRGARRGKLWRDRMFRTPNVATVSLMRRRLDGDFRNAFQKRGLSPMQASRTCGETEWRNAIMNLMRLNAVKENVRELSLAKRWHLLTRQTVSSLYNWYVLCFCNWYICVCKIGS